MDDQTYMPFYDVLTHQESKIWVFEDDPMPTMVKSQRAMNKVMYAIFFRSTSLVKAIKLEGQKTEQQAGIPLNVFQKFQEVNVRGLMLHHDSASFHTAGLTDGFLKQKQIKDRRAASPLVRLVEREERREASDPRNVHPQNWGGTEQNRTVTCMVLKTKANENRKNLVPSSDEFHGP
ncbi:uncharacterized protein TNCV_1372851 [Trichonephila clavipes]|uniref:Transposase n=1 Tax=Trichonephila clavipes TaxID=2585209 RepID=A0A8X7BLG0_TRICX|nr:uncharacterized protein TNCV_1372851 [Trichonephila clavipes]